jgi:hypothetical protein
MNQKQLPEGLKDLIAAISGADHVEVVRVPEGSSIEEELKKRSDPNWCDSCQEVHAEETPESRAAQKPRALENLRKRMAWHLECLDVLKDMEKSLLIPEAERTTKTTLDEVMLMLHLKMLGD